MTQGQNIDGVLVQWGARLFHPGNRIVYTRPQRKLGGLAAKQRAAAIRERIEATVVRRAPQVMVKVTGGGRGMKAIAAHFRYICKNGRLDMEDDRGDTSRGKSAPQGLADDWRYGGTFIDDMGDRREAYNIMLSMPRGTDPLAVQRAAREFAKIELGDHKYVMVLHDHQANLHVHISVRAESRHGKRLNPRKADLHRWRETFAEKPRDQGIEAEATRHATRGRDRNYDTLWRLKVEQDGRLRTTRTGAKTSAAAQVTRWKAVEAWMHVGKALAMSGDFEDRKLADAIAVFIKEMPITQVAVPQRAGPEQAPKARDIDIGWQR